jgi:hypothetical protein
LIRAGTDRNFNRCPTGNCCHVAHDAIRKTIEEFLTNGRKPRDT